MTVTTTVPLFEFTGNGVTTSFPLTGMYVAAAADLEVYEKVIETGVLTLIPTPSYTVVGTIPGSAVSITYNPLGVPLPATKKLFVARVVDVSQTLDIRSQGGYDPTTLELALDSIVMQTQQLTEAVSRTVKVDYGDTPVDAGDIGDLVDDAEDAAAAALAAQAAAEAAVVGNIGAAIHLSPNKATTVDADEFGIWDSVGAVLNRFTWANMKLRLSAFLYSSADSSPLDADGLSFGDSTSSMRPLFITFAQLKTYLALTFAPVSVLYANLAAAAIATLAEHRAATANKLLNSAIAWGVMAEVAQTETDLTTGISLAAGIDFAVTLTASRTMANFTNVKVGQRGRIRFLQNATGGWVVTKSSNHKTAGGAALALPTAANAIGYLYYDCRSSTEVLLSHSSQAWS